MNDHEANSCLWELLPLYADPDPEIRAAFECFLAKTSSHSDKLINNLPRHPDDADVLNQE
jgi:hypothetical protein